MEGKAFTLLRKGSMYFDGSDRIIWREKAVTLLRKAEYIL